MKLKLYRGITVPYDKKEEILEDIRRNGLKNYSGGAYKDHTTPDIKSIRDNMDDLFEKGHEIKKIGHEKNIFYACGTKQGALYYATKHNVKEGYNVPIIISFEVEVDKVFVDGIDFLWPCFVNPHLANDLEYRRKMLKEIYGDKSLEYFEKGFRDPKKLQSCFDLAQYDQEIVEHHYQNKKLIKGRSNTEFYSAFCIEAPISSKNILNCEEAKEMSNNHTFYTKATLV